MMEFHVVIQFWVLTKVEKNVIVLTLTAEAILDGDEEFAEFIPVSVGSLYTLMFVTAHRCPVVERS